MGNFKAGFLDIAPAYSGLAFSLANTLGNVPGFVAPVVVGALLTDYSAVPQWRAVFWISAAVHLAGSILYLGWGSDQVQDWARPGDNSNNKTNNNNNSNKSSISNKSSSQTSQL